MTTNRFLQIKKSYLARFVSWALVHNFVDLLAMYLPVKTEPKKRKRAIFVKMDGVGDYVMWTATFDIIAKEYPTPAYERILIVNDRMREFTETESLFDRVVFVDSVRFVSSVIYRWNVMRQVRALDADIVINPRLTRDFLWGDSIVRVSRAPVRVGSRGINNLMSRLQERISAQWYTELKRPPVSGVHETISNSEFLFRDEPTALPRPILGETIVPTHLIPEGPYAVFFIGAFSGAKRWPIDKFAAVAKEISETFALAIAVCGGPGEEYLGDEFCEYFTGEVANLVGRTSLADLAAVIGGAKLTVTNDTAAGHIAVAQRCPVVVITPGNHVGRFFPYPPEVDAGQVSVIHELPCFGCGWDCIYTDLGPNEPKPCISGVTVEAVLAAAKRLLKENHLKQINPPIQATSR